jgi:hypothetical protein
MLSDEFKSQYSEQLLFVDHTMVVSPGLLEQHLTDFQEITPLAPEMIASFKGRNWKSYPLEPQLEIEQDYQLLTQEYIDEFGEQDKASGWKLFDEKYPKTVGFIYLSRVGFDADFRQALVYFEQYRYDQPVQGGYYLLIRRDKGWEIENGFLWMT